MAGIDNLLTWVLSQAAAQSHRVLQHYLHSAGWTGYEYRILAALADGDPLHQTELGRRAALDRSDVTTNIRNLHMRGLIDRQPDPNHGRRVIITITTAGVEAWSSAERVMASVQDEVFASLTKAERKTLGALLSRVASDLGTSDPR